MTVNGAMACMAIVIAAFALKAVHGYSTNLTCPRTLTCKGKCTNEEKLDKGDSASRQINCHCDPSCTKYKDCCEDLPRFCPKRVPAPPNKVEFTCRQLNDDEPNYWLVERCPSTFTNKDIIEKCHSNESYSAEKFLGQVPVYSFFSKLNYKNDWCAKCHNQLFALLFSLKIKCNVLPPSDYNNTEKLDYILKHCDRIQFTQDDAKASRRYCYPTIDSCAEGASAMEKNACINGPVGVIYDPIKRKNYRNLDCMKCNSNESLVRKAECGPQTSEGNIFNPSSFEVVMNFRSDVKKIVAVKSNIVCNDATHVYDEKLEICRKSLIKPSKGVKDKYEIKMWISPLNGQKPTAIPKKEIALELAHRFVPLDADQIDVLLVAVEDRSTTILFHLSAKYHDMENLITTNETLDLDLMLNFNQSFQLTFLGRPWLAFKVNTRRIACTHKEEYDSSQYKPLPTDDNGKTFLAKIHGKLQRIPKNQYYLVHAKNETDFSKVKLVVCRSSFTVLCNHSMLSLVDEEYTIYQNKSLLFKPTGQWYSEGEYDKRGDTAWICTNYTFKEGINATSTSTTIVALKHKPDIHFTIRRYMTIVGLSISVFCLFLVLLTHGILRDLRTPLPGKNLMSLSLSLFLAHFWFLFGSGDTDKPVFCRVTAYILHYLFLVTFGCSFIVAYDTRRTFSAKAGKAQSLGGYFQHKRLCVYLLLSWGVPFIIVTTCAILDDVNVVAIGYGKGLACWIQNTTALLVIFAVPVAMVLVYNVVAFSQTVYAINSARKHGQRVKSSHYTRPAVVKIYMRLTSLMGFSWFFGISAPFIHDGLMYPFVFFTTLQGLYIFLAFVFKTKVLRMIKASLPLERRKSPTRRGTKGTMTTMADTTPYNKYTSSSKEDTQI